jgi:aldehyde dehydrogenase (NAD+)
MRYNPEVGKVIAKFHLDRIEKLMKEVENYPNCKIEVGGSNHIYKDELYVTPTVYSNPPLNSAMMTEEIFAPILPIVSFVEFDEVVKKHIDTKGKPLAIYYFGNNENNW